MHINWRPTYGYFHFFVLQSVTESKYKYIDRQPKYIMGYVRKSLLIL